MGRLYTTNSFSEGGTKGTDDGPAVYNKYLCLAWLGRAVTLASSKASLSLANHHMIRMSDLRYTVANICGNITVGQDFIGINQEIQTPYLHFAKAR